MIRLYQNFWQKNGLNINNSSRCQYSTNKNIRFKTSMLTSDFCDCSDAYAIVKGRKNNWDDVDKTRKKKLIFKNNAPFRSCISKINSTFIDNTEDLDIASMCNLLKQWQLFYDIGKFVEFLWRWSKWSCKEKKVLIIG